jgi:hypothetical protein
VIRIAFLTVGLFLAYQLAVTLLHTAWRDPGTDWLRVVLACPGLLGVLLLSRWLTRAGQLGALSWWLVSAGLFTFAFARSIWLVEDLFLFPHRVPFPSLADLFLPSNGSCRAAAPPRMKRDTLDGERSNGKDRFDTSALSLSPNVIWMPAKHHRLSLAARRST